MLLNQLIFGQSFPCDIGNVLPKVNIACFKWHGKLGKINSCHAKLHFGKHHGWLEQWIIVGDFCGKFYQCLTNGDCHTVSEFGVNHARNYGDLFHLIYIQILAITLPFAVSMIFLKAFSTCSSNGLVHK